MKILFVCNEYPPVPYGGVGIFTQTIARELVAQKHEVIVAGYDRYASSTHWELDEKVKVLRIKQLPHPRLLRFGRYTLLHDLRERMYLSKTVNNLVRESDVDLVESYDWSGPLWSRTPKPLIVRMHGAHSAYAYYEGRRMPRFLNFIEKRNISLANGLVAVSQHIGELTLNAFRLEKEYRVIYNGVDTNVFFPRKTESDKREILFVGTVSRRKGIFELFQAMPKILEIVPDARLTIVGRLPTDPIEKYNLIDSLLTRIPENKRGAITFTGVLPHSDLPILYSQAACVVFPSLVEAFALVWGEAMACGAAVVLTSRASGPEMIEDKVSGLLVDPSDLDVLAAAVVNILLDKDAREYMRHNAVKRVKKKFSLDNIIQQNIRYYEEMI